MTVVEKDVREAAREIEKAETVLLATHRGPDGDGIGCMVALASVLRARGKSVTIYTRDLVPRHLKWLPLTKGVVRKLPADARFDLTVVVDCGDEKLLGNSLPASDKRGPIVALDHHASGRPFGERFVCDPSAASTGVMVARVFEELDWPLTNDAAVALYVSVTADTGTFRYANTNAEVLRLAAKLVGEYDVDPWAVTEKMHEQVPLRRYRLLERALRSLDLALDNRVAFLQVSAKDIEETKAAWDDTEGLVNYARALKGVECGVLLTPAKGGGVRVSVRSKGHLVDAGKVCLGLGGGGHRGAAGCVLKGEIAAARKTVELALGAALGDEAESA